MVKALIQRPKTLFVVDALGALLSAFFLGVVLVQWEQPIGMPRNILYLLASFPVLFALFDAFSYFQPSSQWKFLLRVIASANTLYMCISLWMLVYHWEQVSLWAYLYFLGELLILLVLVGIEFKAAKSL